MDSLKIQLFAVLLLAFASPVLAGDAKEPVTTTELDIEDAWIRPPLVPGRPAAGYMVILNHGPQDDALVGVASASADRIEFHRSVRDGEISRMVKMDEIAVPGGETVALAPGGTHLMIFGFRNASIAGAPGEGSRVDVVLSFRGAGKMVVPFDLRKTARRKKNDERKK